MGSRRALTHSPLNHMAGRTRRRSTSDRRATVCLASALALVCLLGRTDALDVYRIGGADQPRPSGPGIQFHQLQWQDHTDTDGLEESALASGLLQPFFLNQDENIALTTVARGGGPNVSGNVGYYVTEPAKDMVDADPLTFYEWVETSRSLTIGTLAEHRITVDLGSIFQISRVRLISTGTGNYPDRLDINVEEVFVPTRNHALTGTPVAQVLENISDTIDVSFPPVASRSIGLMLHRITPKAVRIAELEIYGEGFVERASYVGPFIEAGEPALWGDLRWGGRQDEQAEVRIQTRSGSTLDPNVYWRYTGRGSEVTSLDANGQPLTASSYRLLKPGEEAEITYDTDNWSFWTAPYAFADSTGTPILSPAPNPVFQVRVDFLSRDADGGQLNYVELTATRPPLAETVMGEVHPFEVPLGSTAQFTYAILPTIRQDHSGFDRIEISTPFGFTGVDAVRIDRAPIADFEVIVDGPDSTLFAVQLPRRLGTADSGRLVEVLFRAPVLRYATQFQGWVRDTKRPGELAQRISPGEASVDLTSETLSVRTTLSTSLLGDIELASKLLTPNGDRVNDTMELSFSLLQLTDAAPLSLKIFDLAGRLVATRTETVAGSGRFQLGWDGRNESGGLVAPGLYVYRIAVEAGTGRDEHTGTIGVAY